MLKDQDFSTLYTKITAGAGSTVAYNSNDNLFSLDLVQLEYSGISKGDFRHSPLEIKMPDLSFVSDFVYDSHIVFKGGGECHYMPIAYGDDKDEGMYGVFALILGVSQILALICFPFFSNRFTRKQLYSGATILVFFGYIIFFFSPMNMLFIGILLGYVIYLKKYKIDKEMYDDILLQLKNR